MQNNTAPSGIQISTVDIDGQLLRVGIRPGRDAGVPLLVFNGLGANIELLEPFIERLEGVEVVTFDAPGVGGSPEPKAPYQLWWFASLAGRLLDRLGYDAVDVLGVSWGGGAAQQFAFQYPQRCRRLILAATTAGAFLLPGKLSAVGKLVSQRRFTDPAHLAEAGAEIYGGAFADDPALVRDHVRSLRLGTLAGFYYQLLAVVGWTSILWLHLLRQPTLVLAGNRDPLIALINVRLLAWFIPNAALHVFDDGHLFLVSQAAESAEVIGRFLAEAEA
jgi:poly(3-hydroxyalkanoate) depolymerase